jgi:hypothetical protein
MIKRTKFIDKFRWNFKLGPLMQAETPFGHYRIWGSGKNETHIVTILKSLMPCFSPMAVNMHRNEIYVWLRCIFTAIGKKHGIKDFRMAPIGLPDALIR